jgi:phospholipase/carboxylesterase
MAYRHHLTWPDFLPSEGYYTSQVTVPEPRPVRTFLPAGYEPNYPYPLVVFFHGHGGNEEQVMRLAPRLSRRNFICIGLRGSIDLGPKADGRPAYSWGGEGDLDGDTEEYLLRAVEQTRRTYHVHSERVYLAGICEGAALAYRLGFAFSDRLAGVIALNGQLPRTDGPLFRLDAVRGLRVKIGHGIANAVAPLSIARRDARVLFTGGAEVDMTTYPTTHKLHPHMLRDVNRWIMDHIEAETL